jgi:hypothetical protein
LNVCSLSRENGKPTTTTTTKMQVVLSHLLRLGLIVLARGNAVSFSAPDHFLDAGRQFLAFRKDEPGHLALGVTAVSPLAQTTRAIGVRLVRRPGLAEAVQFTTTSATVVEDTRNFLHEGGPWTLSPQKQTRTSLGHVPDAPARRLLRQRDVHGGGEDVARVEVERSPRLLHLLERSVVDLLLAGERVRVQEELTVAEGRAVVLAANVGNRSFVQAWHPATGEVLGETAFWGGDGPPGKIVAIDNGSAVAAVSAGQVVTRRLERRAANHSTSAGTRWAAAPFVLWPESLVTGGRDSLYVAAFLAGNETGRRELTVVRWREGNPTLEQVGLDLAAGPGEEARSLRLAVDEGDRILGAGWQSAQSTYTLMVGTTSYRETQSEDNNPEPDTAGQTRLELNARSAPWVAVVAAAAFLSCH